MEIYLNKFKNFSVGDVVKLKDGDGRHHVIKKFEIDFSIRTGFPFAIVIFEDKISSLRRFKDDVKEVAAGYECGVGLDKFNDIKEGDILEAFEMQEVAR